MRSITLEELKQIALQSKQSLWDEAQAYGRDVKLYLHWTAGHYGQFFDDYHVNIDADGSIYLSTENLAAVKNHTYGRNTGAIGIALACAYNATTNDLGPEPPTNAQIETVARVVAVLAGVLDLTIDVQRVMTHAEAADQDGYGPETTCERWDLWFYPGVSPGQGGAEIRGKAIWYMQQEAST